MKVYVVNLARDVERMASVKRQLDALGVPFERVDAVDGRAMSADELRRAYSPFRWWCAKGWRASRAEVGCALSHNGIYKAMLEEGVDVACILEDDVELGGGFKAALDFVARRLDAKRIQVAMLSNHGDVPHDRLGGCIAEEDGFELLKGTYAMCTDGYCLTRAAAQALLEQNMPVMVPCDSWERWAKKGKIDLYHVWPPAVRQQRARFGSMTSAGRKQMKDMTFSRKILFKLSRAAGMALDAAMCVATGR